MSVVEEIYSRNKERIHPRGNARTRGVLSLRNEIEERNRKGRIGLIVEFKRRSPSGFRSSLETVEKYFCSIPSDSAAGLSVLTEPTEFGGSWNDLISAQSFNRPLLSKDFTNSEAMIRDAYNAGGDAILLIADFLDAETIERLSDFADGLKMDALIEFHDMDAAERIPIRSNVLVGYNRRNLRTMRMEDQWEDAAGMFDRRKVPFILESGVNARNAESMDFSEFSGLLVGSSIISGESVIDVLRGRGLL